MFYSALYLVSLSPLHSVRVRPSLCSSCSTKPCPKCPPCRQCAALFHPNLRPSFFILHIDRFRRPVPNSACTNVFDPVVHFSQPPTCRRSDPSKPRRPILHMKTTCPAFFSALPSRSLHWSKMVPTHNSAQPTPRPLSRPHLTRPGALSTPAPMAPHRPFPPKPPLPPTLPRAPPTCLFGPAPPAPRPPLTVEPLVSSLSPCPCTFRPVPPAPPPPKRPKLSTPKKPHLLTLSALGPALASQSLLSTTRAAISTAQTPPSHSKKMTGPKHRLDQNH